MKKFFLLAGVAALLVMGWTSCNPLEDSDDNKETTKPVTPPDPVDPGTEEDKLTYDDLAEYKALRTYVNRTLTPDFKLGAAVTVSNFLRQTQEYKTVTENFNEMTAGNAMKQSSVLKDNGSMDFTQVRNFLNAADKAGMTVYGHTLAWHSQQSVTYLNSLIQSKKVENPGGNGEMVILQTDFNDGQTVFNGWGNNSTKSVVDGTLKITNPSAVNYWEAQIAYDVNTGFEKGTKYKMSFKIKGSASGKLMSGFQILDGYKSAGDFPAVNFTTEWQTVDIVAECTSEGATRLIYSFGDFAGDIYIDDFVFSATGVDYIYEEMTAAEKKVALVDAMDRWIKGMMEVTATRVSAWDAVNEAISGRDNDRDGFYELESAAWGSDSNFYWQDYLGSEDYVRIVIEKARKYYAEYGGTAPLRLFINDYNLESDWDDNKKLKSLIHWIEIWESDGVTKIDGIGSQMHVSYYEDPNTQKRKEDHVVKMLQLMADTGKLVKISELDMGYVDRNGETLSTAKMTDTRLRQMADFYDFIVSKYFEIVPVEQQYGITQWCPTDAPVDSFWRPGEPLGLWDQNYNRKYAYAGFANGLISNL